MIPTLIKTCATFDYNVNFDIWRFLFHSHDNHFITHNLCVPHVKLNAKVNIETNLTQNQIDARVSILDP